MKKVFVVLLCGLLALSAMGCGDAREAGKSADNVVAESQIVDAGADAKESDATEVDTAKGEQSDASAESGDAEAAVPEVALRQLFEQHGMKVGTCLTTRMISNAKLSELVTTQFSSATMENDMKPDAILDKKASKDSGQIVVSFGKDMIKMLDWAKENNMALRGHTLVWYSQTPGWLFHEGFDMAKPLVSRQEMLERMERMISEVFRQLDEKGYSDLFYAYDVVNEAWMEDGKMRTENNLWYSTIGEDYIWYAFYYARKYAPEHIQLFYNDYNEQYKTETLIKFVDTLKDDNGEYMLDGIGLQAHLYTSDDLNSYFRTVDKLAQTGLTIELTELDVSLGAWQNTKPATDENLKAQGRYYYNLIEGILERVDNGTLASDALTFWGFSDGMSWRKAASPLLYDALYQPKYALYGAAQEREYAGF